MRAADRRECHRRDGAVSMQSWLRGSCRLAPAEATAMVSAGRRLEQLPATAEAFAAGEITATHARLITRAVSPRRVAKAAEAGIELAETNRILAELARQTNPAETARGVARWVSGVVPTVPSTTRPTPAGGSPWPAASTAGCTCAVTWTPSAGTSCTPRWPRS
ncbi:DUF222 domain-containing protein [Geodermatophilus sp. SYSU D00703]